ncbi:MAG TPA: CaiB/BaiF CoA-transferase family protein, partial [Agriterribacter sp.]|nr:CaiB/BaiF CoA-transferase family protein [Agriterribacter sp.]
GLGYEMVKKINPAIVYTQISGYGEEGPWKKKPGQDLLLQSLSGLAYTTGSYNDPPTPLGLGIGDYLCGNQAVQFIIAALIKARRTGEGSFLQLSLLESLIDFQFEFLTTFFQSGRIPQRAAYNNANPLLSAPYGIYKTSDGFLAIAMMPLEKLNQLLQCMGLSSFKEEDAFSKRDTIKITIARCIETQSNQYWLRKAEELDLWIMPVFNWKEMKSAAGYKSLDMEQEIALENGRRFITTRCPIRINKKILKSDKAAPAIGADNKKIMESLG